MQVFMLVSKYLLTTSQPEKLQSKPEMEKVRFQNKSIVFHFCVTIFSFSAAQS